MEQINNKPERIHAFDSLRVTIMFLVIVAHSALTYNVTSQKDLWPLKDPHSNNAFCDLIVYLVHTCSMPVFYLTAGFFGAMLFYERGIFSMLKNRLRRLVYPFIVFVIILYPIITVGFSFTSAVFSGSKTPLSDAVEQFSIFTAFFPLSTYHLWFLYHLIYFTFAIAGLALLLRERKKLTSAISNGFNWLIKRPFLKIVVLSSISLCLMLLFKKSIMQTPVSLIPDIQVLAYFSVFYCFGWLLYKSKNLFESMTDYAWLFMVSAVILALIKAAMLQYLSPDLVKNISSKKVIAVSAVALWLFTFGITGLFIKYTNKPSAIMRYVSDASYWIYLVHLPLTVVIPAFIYNWPVPAMVKFLTVLAITTFLSFLSYHLLVRSTFIGKFLNGRKYPRRLT